MGTRSEQLARIPETISRKAYIQLVESALPGIDRSDICGLEFTPRAIVAEVYARDEDGAFVLDGDSVATHSIVIPVRD